MRIGLVYDVFDAYPWNDGDPPDADAEYDDIVTIDGDSLERLGAETDMGEGQRVYAVRYVDDTAYVSSYFDHHGEEDVLRGSAGSGTMAPRRARTPPATSRPVTPRARKATSRPAISASEASPRITSPKACSASSEVRLWPSVSFLM